jgi:hypothetical protein
MNSVKGLGESNGVMTMLLDIQTLIGNQLPVNDDDFLASSEKKN